MFSYPPASQFGRVVPKVKIYEAAKPRPVVKQRIVSLVERIVWSHKLSPLTTNLPETKSVLEIEVFDVFLKTQENEPFITDVLSMIDKGIRHPIFFRLIFENQIKTLAAYKRPHEAADGKWVTSDYFGSDWQNADYVQTTALDDPRDETPPPLPIALNLGTLYEAMMQTYLPLPPRKGESIRAQIDRISEIQSKERELAKLESKRNREKQFNRKVEINSVINQLQREIEKLSEA